MTYQPAAISNPITSAPTTCVVLARNRLSANTKASNASTSTAAVARWAAAGAMPVSLATAVARLWSFQPRSARFNATGSSRLARHCPNKPLSVMYAAIATNTSTTSERTLP